MKIIKKDATNEMEKIKTKKKENVQCKAAGGRRVSYFPSNRQFCIFFSVVQNHSCDNPRNNFVSDEKKKRISFSHSVYSPLHAAQQFTSIYST